MMKPLSSTMSDEKMLIQRGTWNTSCCYCCFATAMDLLYQNNKQLLWLYYYISTHYIHWTRRQLYNVRYNFHIRHFLCYYLRSPQSCCLSVNFTLLRQLSAIQSFYLKTSSVQLHSLDLMSYLGQKTKNI